MWSSANGSGMRSHSTPGADFDGAPLAGRRAGKLQRGCRRSGSESCGRADAVGCARRLWYRGRAPGPIAPHGSPCGPLHAVRAPTGIQGRTTYSISDLAREFALTTRAIRFYEDCGLVRPERAGRARVYGERERVRIKLILRGKRLGLSLAEIGDLLDSTRSRATSARSSPSSCVILEERRARLLQQKEDIDAVLAEIDGVERECRRRLKEDAPAARGRVPAVAGPGGQGDD
jgi:DNA-binding transcriptional MerR regulator